MCEIKDKGILIRRVIFSNFNALNQFGLVKHLKDPLKNPIFHTKTFLIEHFIFGEKTGTFIKIQKNIISTNLAIKIIDYLADV